MYIYLDIYDSTPLYLHEVLWNSMSKALGTPSPSRCAQAPGLALKKRKPT